MARLKSGLAEIFDACKTYQEVFSAMSKAKAAGFTPEDINKGVTQANRRIKQESAQNYKRIPVTYLDNNKKIINMVLPVKITGNVNSPKITFNGTTFEV